MTHGGAVGQRSLEKMFTLAQFDREALAVGVMRERPGVCEAV
jgi:hypothetical protein